MSAAAQTPIPIEGAKNDVLRVQEYFQDVEEVDPHNGDLLLTYRELLVPGNGGMDIEIKRAYAEGPERFSYEIYPESALGDRWSIYIAPRVYEVFPAGTSAGLCSGAAWISTSKKYQLVHTNARIESLWHASVGEARSSSNWRLTCPSGTPILTSPHGVQYLLGSRKQVSGVASTVVQEWQATQITDISGNTVTIQYSDALGSDQYSVRPYLPVRITASDGRAVDLTYSPVTVGNRTHARLVRINSPDVVLQYEYVDARLTKAVRADGTFWTYEYFPSLVSSWDVTRRLKSVTLPTGGKVSYEYEEGPAAQSWLICQPTPNGLAPGMPTRDTTQVDIRVKTRTAGSAVWTFTYTLGLSEGEYDVTTIDGPAGQHQYRHIGMGYFVPAAYRNVSWAIPLGDDGSCSRTYTEMKGGAWKLGLLVEKRIGSDYVEQLDWIGRVSSGLTQGQFVLSRIPLLAERNGATLDAVVRVPEVSRRIVNVNGASHTTEYSNFDGYGNPGTIVESGPNGGSRTTTLTYHVDTTKWIVNKLKNESFPGQSITRTFDSNGRLTAIDRNGVTTSYTYDGEGNIATATLPRQLTHSYSSYKRGVPRSEVQPEGITLSRAVSDAGYVTSETDGEGHVRNFSYDGMGRITSIDYARGNDSATTYTATTKTTTRGSLTEMTTFDGLGRPSSVVLGGIQTLYSHDALGRRTFQSNPGESVGRSYQYDVLNRVTRVTNADSTFRTYTYGPANVTERDERGKYTTYSYRGYGTPDSKVLMSITAPDTSANVTIGRGPDDLVTSVTQAGVTRSFDYDSRKYLTSETNPETGTTTYGRDAAGNMTTRTVAGVSTSFVYDGHNRLMGVTYPAGTPSVTHAYSRTHKLRSVTSSSATRVLAYDENDNLTGETLTIGSTQLGAQYGYTGNDQLSSITYPVSGRVVNFAPDALGRPTQATGYVNTVSYWPSGMFREIQYANGIVTNYDQNNRLWPSTFRTRRSGTHYVNSSYNYDGVGNLTSITDAADANMNRSLAYDDLNRLTTANGPWGAGSLSYDGAGNIRSQSFGGYGLTYAYDGQNRLSSVSGSQNSSYTYDVYGNITAGSGSTYQYDSAPSLRCVNCGGGSSIDYSYDGLNKRVSVTKAGVTSYEFYASSGDLLVEYTPSQSNKLVEYIHLGGKRIAQRVSDSRPPTSVTLPRSTVVANRNNGVTLTVNIGGASPAGTVTFMENGNVIGTAYVVNGQASIDVLGLTLGNHTITAVYSGDANNSGNSVVMQVKVVNLDWLPAVLNIVLN